MAKTFVFDRYDVLGDYGCEVYEEANAEGKHVKAQDAIDRDEVLKAQIRVLELQLKEAKQVANSFRNVGVWDPDGHKFKTYRTENLDGVSMYVKE